MPAARRFPLRWSLDEEHNHACFIVRDNDVQALAYFYFGDEPGRRSAAKLLTKDEAGRDVQLCVWRQCWPLVWGREIRPVCDLRATAVAAVNCYGGAVRLGDGR